MHNYELISTLAAGFVAALALGYTMHRMGWSPIVGYLLAGIAMGPHTPGFVANHELAEQLAEIGVVLLMFGVGLHFHVQDLLAVKRIAITGAIVQSGVATALGAITFHSFGWNWGSGLVFGLALSVASTVVLIRVLSDHGELQSPAGRIAVGWLVVEDVFTVFVLVLLPVLFGNPAEGTQQSLPVAIGLAAVKLAAFTGLMLWGASRVIPKLLTEVARTRSRELFTLSVLAIALGIAVGAAWLFNVSMALGAFLAGMAVGQSEFSARAGAEALPLRDAFAVMFFLSVGLLFDPHQAMDSPLLIAASAGIVLIGKPVAAAVITGFMGYGSAMTARVALALAQIGEFSFVLATLGRQLGALPNEAMNALVATAIVSITLNPVVYRYADRIAGLFVRRSVSSPGEKPEPADTPAAHRAVIVGYGPIGRMVARILRSRGIEPVVIEMNIDTYHKLRDAGQKAVYGDARQPEVLEKAGIARATSFILSASFSEETREAIRTAREMNPRVHVVVRANFVAQNEALISAGADEVFSGEGEVALAMADSLLRRLGATPEQLDEAREQIRQVVQTPSSAG